MLDLDSSFLDLFLSDFETNLLVTGRLFSFSFLLELIFFVFVSSSVDFRMTSLVAPELNEVTSVLNEDGAFCFN